MYHTFCFRHKRKSAARLTVKQEILAYQPRIIPCFLVICSHALGGLYSTNSSLIREIVLTKVIINRIGIMSNEISKALNTQINNEFYSAYLYLAMSAYFQRNNLLGFAKWLKMHAREETMHAMKMYDYVINRNWQINLLPIESPIATWNSPVEVLSSAYKHEQQVTNMINNLAKLAIQHNDYATNIFMQWFITEQIEEEAVFNEVYEKLKLIEGTPAALLFLDAELDKKAAA